MKIEVVTEQALRQSVALDKEALAAVEQAFLWASSQRAEIPAPMNLRVEAINGELDVKGAYVHGLPIFAIKIASGFFDNVKMGLPVGSGVVLVFDAKTGFCRAVLCDNGYLTDLRTALAGAVAARYAAPEEIETVGIVGAGAQARWQLRAIALVRDFKRVLVYGRNLHKVESYCEEMGGLLPVPIQPCDSLEALVRESQLVVTTTPSRKPLISADWLHPGLHITAMGSDHSGKQELEAEVLRKADRLFCDLRPQASRLGELQYIEKEYIQRTIELGDIVQDPQLGRSAEDQITICDLTGIGTQDTAIANHAMSKLR